MMTETKEEKKNRFRILLIRADAQCNCIQNDNTYVNEFRVRMSSKVIFGATRKKNSLF